MKLIHINDYLSIKEFRDTELPNFTVLTGLNGAGKSHLLKAIKNGNIMVEGININEIIDFNNITFSLDKETKVSFKTILEDRQKVFNFIEKNFKKTPNPYKAELSRGIDKIISYCKENDMSFYQLTEIDFNNIGIPHDFQYYSNFIRISNQKLTSPTGSINRQVIEDIKKLKKFCFCPIEDITIEELNDLNKPYNYKNDFLITHIGRVFSDYWQKKENNDYKNYRNKNFNESNVVLTDGEFELEYGIKPWQIINSILNKFGSLNYYVNNPEGLDRDSEFQLDLISLKDPQTIVGFENLSSGERTMMALVSSIYKSMIDKKFPKLLLLDEIDASLHPSMSKVMLDVIQEEFINKNNIKVILVTHSPSTVALAPEDSIYVMQKEGLERIIKSNNKDALNILTEGFASLTNDETNLKVSYNISKSIDYVLLTEGITDRIILEAAWDKIEKSVPNFTIQDCFDASFLRNLFSRKEIFTNYPNKTFIAIFDFDKEGYEAFNSFKDYELIESNPKKGLLKKSKNHNAFVMLLPVPENVIQHQVIKSGNQTFEDHAHMPIELLFHEVEKVNGNFISETQVGGGILIKFSGDKVSFATKIKEEFGEHDLKNIKPIFETLKSIFKK